MFIGAAGIERTKVELKYCESCGALWLRKQGGSEANCGACEVMWMDLPGAWIERLRRKPEVDWRSRARRVHSTTAMLGEVGRA